LKERIWFSYIIELLTATICLFFGFDDGKITELVVFALVIVCLLSARLLITLSKAPIWLSWICALGCVVALFIFERTVFLAIFTVLMYGLISDRQNNSTALGFSLIASFLLMLLFPQTPGSLLSTMLGIILMFSGTMLINRLNYARSELNTKDERISSLEAQLENQRSTISAIEQQGRQAERNRITARIHDKVGHGITGSILILEAARLQMDKDPETALKNLDKATENLRHSVDEIRHELRDERSENVRATLAGIAQTLDEFSQNHERITTELVTEGLMLESIPQSIFFCIHECLRETLTNMLKHSDGDRFRLFISLQNRLVYAEFSDNGTGGQTMNNRSLEKAVDNWKVIPGIGLAGIQERVLMNGGKVFFSLDSQGFRTRMTFTLRGQA